jgi:hypothetical protein
MARKGLLEKGLVVGASAIEVPGWSITRREGPTLPARVVPGAEGIPGTVQGAEELLAGFGTGLPSS